MGKVRGRALGLTLVEVMVSFVLILLITLYLMSMFATGQSHWLRAQQYSIGSFLVHQKLQELLQTPVNEIVPGKAKFPLPYAEYTYQVELSPYEATYANLFTLNVEVTSDVGSVAQARTLLGNSKSFQGVSVDPFTNQAAYATPSQLNIYDDQAGTTSVGPAFVDARLGGGVSGWPGGNLLWQIGQMQALDKMNDTVMPLAWGPLASALAPAGLSSPRFSGLASDRFGNVAVVGDTSNRCLWVYEDPGPGAGSWVSTPLRPQATPLGIPSGVAVDPLGSLIWVADQENQCLRKFVFQGPAGPAFEPNVGGVGYWQKQPVQPPANITMGAPQGVAMDSQGWAVYVVDRARLYRYVDDTGEWLVLGEFSDAVIRQGLSGISLDSFGNVLFVNTNQGKLYKLPLPATGEPTGGRALAPSAT